jgi:hypothetical protein
MRIQFSHVIMIWLKRVNNNNDDDDDVDDNNNFCMEKFSFSLNGLNLKIVWTSILIDTQSFPSFISVVCKYQIKLDILKQ